MRGEHERLISALEAGKSCAVIEAAYCAAAKRAAFVAKIKQAIPGVTVRWQCFTNDLAQTKARQRYVTQLDRRAEKTLTDQMKRRDEN